MSSGNKPVEFKTKSSKSEESRMCNDCGLEEGHHECRHHSGPHHHPSGSEAQHIKCQHPECATIHHHSYSSHSL